MTGKHGFFAYLSEFLRFDPKATKRAAFFNLAAAAGEGAGLMLLLPILSLAGVFDRSAASPPWLLALKKFFAAFGIELNLGSALMLFVVLVFLQSRLALYRDIEAQSLQRRFGDSLRKRLYAAIAASRWSFHLGRHSGEIIGVLTSEVQRIVTGTHFLLRSFTVSLLSLAYLYVAIRLSAALTLIAIVAGLALWLVLRHSNRSARQGGGLLSLANQKMFSQIQEFLTSMKLIKIHGEEEGNVERFGSEVEKVSNRFSEYQLLHSRVQAFYRVGGAATLALLSFAAVSWFKIPAAKLLVSIAIFARVMPFFAELQGGWKQMLYMLPAFAAWKSLLEECEANRDPHQSGIEPVRIGAEISFVSANYRHPQSHHLLSTENLLIPARKTTAVVGPSGSGKTTLLDLLSGLVVPDSGEVSVDGIPLERLPGWRRSIAYIPQETLIQNGTLRDNLVWGNSYPQEEEIWQALEQAALAEWVGNLPLGLQTEVGERGVKLSGGEKQRLAIARALLRKPELLILDEATSALDPENHRLVIDSIRALHGRITVLLVSHRLDELSGLIDGMIRVVNGKVGNWEAV